ncbi:GNAT family N-acetyltransferase [Clostridium rectalis]|uniref:GNAT family N-acetyltransferase n=1 Tax=Clostridium rectalis TaxID=2040295 RepID=UPI000F635252|nr:GNAT family N-acetyltransferase [Clostridium rectalis]
MEECIEEFKYKDLKECIYLFIDAFKSEPWNDKWDFNTAFKRLEDIYYTPKFNGLVYKIDNKIVGVIMGNYEQWYEGMYYNLKEFFVDKTIQGRGIGSKMIDILERELKERGIKSIQLLTIKNHKTEGFYMNNGYKSQKYIINMSKNI